MRSDKTDQTTHIIIGNVLIEEVVNFDYLGSLITNTGDGVKEIKRRLGRIYRDSKIESNEKSLEWRQ